jgi:hypothetical protein
MSYSKGLPLKDHYDERDFAARDLDAGRLSDQRTGSGSTHHRSRPGTSYRSSGFNSAQFKGGRPSTSRHRKAQRRAARYQSRSTRPASKIRWLIATLQAAEQDIVKKIAAPAPQK